MNKKTIIMYDLETDSADVKIAQPIQISALAIDPLNLQIIPNSEFDGLCKPEGFDDEDYLTPSRKATYEFHAKNKGISLDEILAKVEQLPPLKMVFKEFVEYTKKYHDRQNNQSLFSAPINAGYNNFNFDDVITKRLCVQYKYTSKDEPNIFFWRDSIDLMKLVFSWFEGASDPKAPKDYKMDTLRPLFKVNTTLADAHTGIQDCRDQAELLVRFLKLNRRFYPKVGWPWRN